MDIKLKKRSWHIEFLILMVLILFIMTVNSRHSHASEPVLDNTVTLSSEEKAWLKEHPEIRFAFSADYPPALILDEDGHLSGQMKDVIDLLNQRLGSNFGITVAEIKAVREMIANKEVAGQLALTAGNGARRGLLETHVLWETYPVIYAPKDSPMKINALEDLKGKAVSTLKGSRYAEKILAPYQDKIDIVRTDTIVEAFRLVYEGKVDYMIGLTTQAYYLTKMRFLTLEPAFVMTDRPIKVVMGVRDDWPKLVEILNKGLKSITEDEWLTINDKWLGSPDVIPPQLSLTLEEQAWLSAHPTIRFGFIEGYSPYLMVDAEGNQIGIFVDIKDQLSRRLGVNIVLEQIKTIPELFNRSENKEIDVVNALFPQRADSRGLLQTKVFLRSHIAIYTGKGVIVEKLDDIRGKTVVVQKNVAFVEQVVQPYLGQIKIIHANTPVDGLKMLSSQKADLFVGTTTHNYHVIKNRLFGIIQAWVQTDKSIPFVMGIRPDWPELVPILNKGLASFGTNGIDAIVAKWIGEHPDPIQKIRFTPEEKEWFAKNHTVRVRVSNVEPYIFVREGKPQGIAIDLLNLISERTGLKFRFIVPSPSFAIDLERIAKHESPDLISTIMRTPEREKFLLFTANYSTSPRFIFTRDDSEFVSGMEGLSGRTVAVVHSFVVHKYLEKNHPEIKLAVFKDVADSLKAVSSGKAFAFIGDLKFVPIMITRLGLHNLKVVAPSSLPDHVHAMAIRNDWPELQSILDKGLGSISGEEKSAIISKWTAVKFDYGIKPADVLKWVLAVGGSALVIVFLFVFWNRILRKQVKERTHKLADSEEQFRATFEQAAVGIAHNSMDGRFLRVNRKFCDIVGYSNGEMLKLTFQDITYPDDLEADLEQARRILSGQSSTYAMEKRYKRKNGEIVWVHLTVSLLRENSGSPRYFIAAVKDISDRKKAEIRLQKYQQRLKALAFQLTIAEEKERRRIATDLHDQVGQSLAFARIQIAAAQKLDVEDRLKTKLDDISATLMETIQETRYLVFELSSPFMNEIGLSAAISEWLEDHIEKRHHLKTEFIDEIDESLRKTLDNNIRAIIFRNVRELLINVVKHATAEKVQVTLKNTAETIKVTVMDDGVGFDPGKMDERPNQQREFGLFSIQERMTDLGGSLVIVSEPGKGCKAILIAPIEIKLEE